MQNVLITPEGIQKNLQNIKPLDSICEYIWNGFDAAASEIRIVFHNNELGIVEKIEITDNGDGICFDELTDKFQRFNVSSKGANDLKISLPRGRRGIGRLTFFAFALSCRWDTVYRKDDQNYEYYIQMNKNQLNQYDDNDGKNPHKTNKCTGTKVTISNLEVINKTEVVQRIKEEFFWFLELNKNRGFRIIVDNDEINCNDLIQYSCIIDTNNLGLKNNYTVSFVHWNTKLGAECSRIYYLNSDGIEKYKETTRLNRKADQFYHSIYIKSDYFEDFLWETGDQEGQKSLYSSKADDEYKSLMKHIYSYVIAYRKKYLKDTSDCFINSMIENEIYPRFKDGVIGEFQKEQLDKVVGTLYIAQPKIFTGINDDNKKIVLSLLNLIIENGNKPQLFEILQQVIELTEEETEELANLLKNTTLSNISKTVQILADRLKTIQVLKDLVFSDSYSSYEKHIQEVVEENYWIFGEQYNLITAAEPDFEQALRGLIVSTTGKDDKVSIGHPDKNKEMDIYMLRQDRKGQVTENVVVELKRPSIYLGEKEVSQVKRYMRVIQSDPRFNAGNTKWTFYLVGNQYDNSKFIEGELESHKYSGQQFLIHTADNSMTNIYVLKWSEVFNAFSKRYDFIMDKLSFQQELWLTKYNNADEATASLGNSTAKMPEAVIPKRK